MIYHQISLKAFRVALSQSQLFVIAMTMEAEAERQMKRQQLKAVLREKIKELEMLKSKKQNMLALQTAKDKVVADFMLFTEAIQKNDTETAQKFDEKAMKNTILSMMTNGQDHSGNNVGFATGNSGKEV